MVVARIKAVKPLAEMRLRLTDYNKNIELVDGVGFLNLKNASD